jgi:myo-inositol-1(or 4)-monophosphatase
VGVVYDPSHEELFTALEGQAALLNGTPIAVAAKDDLATALVGTGFGYDAKWRGQQGQVMAAVLPRVRDIRRGGSAALDLCSVACGRLDAYYERGVRWWDVAAGALVVRQAGGLTGAIEGGPVRQGSVLASAPGVHELLRAALLEAEAAAGIAPDR